ncbi:hypothetical protein CAEBREN_26075 [Caenorhabditis brenneri]|uniref:Protein kinase domain-containing protein n=1 Tax=Caenorhabditis brenneri TaxID=135651 RepID=G0MFK7_CAEBE|nr:hypothetical protein CAEBREN_26075 [Caenorhabditis brenneri]
MAVSTSIESHKLSKKVEVLARACADFGKLSEKLKMSTTLDDFDILYNMGKYQLVVDGQKTLDEAIKHNGRKLVVEFVLQKSEEDASYPFKSQKVGRIADEEPLIQTLTVGRMSSAGSLAGKSYGLQSQTSRYSEKVRNIPGRYNLGRKIGEGSLGSVYIAESKKGGTYAVKIVSKHGRHLPQEADVDYLKMLRHERIVEYMYIIEPSGSNDIHILMEYMHSGSLKEYIDRNGPLHHELTKAYTKQILEGLDFLHSKNIIHQDLKPANLLLKNTHRERLIKIADFGSSRFATLKKTRAGQQGRTPKYTDPGVSLGREIAGKRSDIWSLGVIVIEMYTKVYPWDIEGQHPITIPRILDECPPQISITDKVDEDLVKMAKLMLLPVIQRPYAQALLLLPVLQESSQEDDQESDSDDDFF